MFGDSPITVHRLVALWKHLPPESAWHSYYDGDWWTLTNELLAVSVELAFASVKLQGAAVGVKPDGNTIRIPRPYHKGEEEAPVFAESVVTTNPSEAFKLLRGE